MINREELSLRASEYARQTGAVLGEPLGFGIHGIVFATECQAEIKPSPIRSALKVFHREQDYVREKEVYIRLHQHSVASILGCHVPQLLHYDDQLWAIEMTIVTRPFVLDFAGAYLDKAPDFSPEVLADWNAEKEEHFEGKWAEVQAILRSLEGYGVYMLDVNPGNVSLSD